MTGSALSKLPFQPMLGKNGICIMPMQAVPDEQSYLPHRHDFYMLLVITKGRGEHAINFKKFGMNEGSVFFLHQGNIHQVYRYADEGWVVLFNQAIFNGFLSVDKYAQPHGLFDLFNAEPEVKLTATALSRFLTKLEQLENEHADNRNSPAVLHYLYILLIYANQGYHAEQKEPSSHHDLVYVRKLKLLIENHFKAKKETQFYYNHMGLSYRALNRATLVCLGKSVRELIDDRVITESKMLLGGTSLNIKEIAAELGFDDQGYFGRFFKTIAGLTPSGFRDEIKGKNSPND